MLLQYNRLLNPSSDQVSEETQPYHYLTERHLQALWYEQKFFEKLTATDSSPIQVLSPGIWNTEAGPDFLKAHLRIGGVEFKGDIEIHLRSSGWVQHKHHLNEAYDGVILHLSFWKPRELTPTLTSNGSIVPQAFLEDSLTVPLEQLSSKIDLDLYPYRTHAGTGKCGQKLFPQLSVERTEELLTAAAEWRLQQKRRVLSVCLDSPGLQYAAGVAMALGYKNNSDAFLQLFLRLYKLRTLPEKTLLALALGGCGFFEAEWLKRWAASAYYEELYGIYQQHKDLTPHGITLKLTQVRPMNHPVRRLAYLIKWIQNPRLETFRERISHYWSGLWRQCYVTQRWKPMHEGLAAFVPEYDDPHWFSHYTFETKSAGSILPLMGSSLKNEILVNVMIPLIHQTISDGGDHTELKAFHAFYSSLRAMPKGKTQYLTHRFFGEEEKGRLLSRAMLEQGAYQLHRDFCHHFEASCEGCPFIERYQGQFC